MNTAYHWLGFALFWFCILCCAVWLARFAWRYLLQSDTNKWPWLFWSIFYMRRALGYHRYKPTELRPPFLYNRSDYRPMTKAKAPLIRRAQASTIRYNRRRWQAQ